VILRAVLGVVFYAALIAWLFWPTRLAWSYLPVPNAVRWTAVALLVPVVALRARRTRRSPAV